MGNKFKAGDKVCLVKGHYSDSEIGMTGVLIRAPYGSASGGNAEVTLPNGEIRTWLADHVKLVTAAKIAPPRFILQYELDEDPFELFATEKEVRARIKDLAERRDLKRDSIKVYEIKNVRAVKLGTSIKFTK